MNLEYCIITASSPLQAKRFNELICARQKAGLYPREIQFFVCSDPPAGRVGSGGGTLFALAEFLRSTTKKDDNRQFLAEHSILMIHAGGESRRLPSYVPEGKLFAPVPAASSSLLSPSVLDLELSLYLKYPWVRGELVVASGDVIIDFDTESLELPEGDAITGFAAPESFLEGSRHGVFVFDPLTGKVLDYLQKASPETLTKSARIEGSDACALDMGIVSFRGGTVTALYELLSCKIGEESIEERLARGVFSCDLYFEMLTACLGGINFDEYFGRIADKSPLSRAELSLLFDTFHPLGLSGILAKNHSFVHFGSVAEFGKACLEQRERGLLTFYIRGCEELTPQLQKSLVLFNSIDVEIDTQEILNHHTPVCVENCRLFIAKCEGENLFVGLRELRFESFVPRGICVDERKLEDGASVRIVYGANDTFKRVEEYRSIIFCGVPIEQWLRERSLAIVDVASRNGVVNDLYEMLLFVRNEKSDFIEGYWRTPEDVSRWRARFLAGRRVSIAEANRATDVLKRDLDRREARARTMRASLATIPFSSLSALDCAELASNRADMHVLEKRYATTDDPLLRAYRAEVLRHTGSKSIASENRVPVRFWSKSQNSSLSIAVKQDQIVWARSPVRLDLAGGWTDTPPYTNRYGGTVVNVAVDLNGQSPIQVFVRRMPEPFVRVHSIDLGVTEDIRTAADLRAYRDPQKAFALPRAALVLLGLDEGLGDKDLLSRVLMKAGGGLEITLLCAVPKGSGLGTSSVLAGTILAALERFFNVTSTQNDLFLKVLEMEQMLTTGGGWQDQIGGLVGGIKYIESKPGLKPRPIIHQLDPWIFESVEAASRMTLFYTGVTRLAKNILSDVVSRVNSMDRAFLYTHGELKRLAEEARDALSLRDYHDLGRIVGESFRENKLIHASTTNEMIDELAAETAKYSLGMKLLGAGGGGFALFLSPDEKARTELRALLKDRFEDERARLVDFSLNKIGLQVTVS